MNMRHEKTIICLMITRQIFDLMTGVLVANISFETPIHSVAVDPAELRLFSGGENGVIYETKLHEKPSSSSGEVLSRNTLESKATFTGHE